MKSERIMNELTVVSILLIATICLTIIFNLAGGTLDFIDLIIRSFILFVLIVFLALTRTKPIVGAVFGILCGTICLFTFNILTILFGLAIIIDCARLITCTKSE